jgi:PAS domain S-box-containing protein
MIEPKEMIKIFQENYKAITENIEELIVIINQTNQVEYINKLPLMKSLGYSIDDFMGKSWLNYVHREDLEKVINTLEICSEENPISQKIRLQHRKGNFKTFTANYSMINGHHNNILIVLKDLIPVVAQKEEEDQPKEISDKYSLIIENANDIIALYNDKLDLEYVNESVSKRLLGYSFEDLKGKNSINIIYPEDRRKSLDSFKKAFQEGEAIGESRIKCRKGGYKWLESKGKIFFENGDKKLILISRDITAKKEAEKKIKDSEMKYRLIAENVNDMVTIVNEKAQIEYINEEIHKKYMGYSINDIMGKNALELIHPDDHEKVLLGLRNAILNGEGSIEARILHKNGKYVWTETNGRRYRDNDGRLMVLTISKEISERKIAELRNKESEERIKYLISSSPSVIYTAKASKGFEITFMSENVREKTGYDPDDFLKNPRFWETKIHPEDKQIVLSRLSQLPTLENLGFEYRLKYKDGLYHWVRHDIKLIKDDRGIPTETIGSLIDITLNKKNEEKIQYQAKLVDHISDAIISTDLNFNIISWNKAAESIYGWKINEVLMKNMRDIIPNAHPYDNPESLLDNLLGKGIWRGEATHSKKDGEKLNVFTSISLIKDITGKPIGAVSINHDITDIKKAEEKIRESELRYRDLFENSPVALMEQDFSELKIHVDKLKSSGINDFEKYFNSHPEEILKCMVKVKTVNVNKKTLEVYKAGNRKQVFLRLNQTPVSSIYLSEDVLLDNKREMLSLINGKTIYESEVKLKNFEEEIMYVYVKTSILPGFEDTWQKVILSIVDITNLKNIQEKLRESELKFRTIAEQSALGVVIQQDGIIKYANAAVAEMVEYPLQIVSNWTVEDTYNIIHKEDVELITKKFEERQENKFPYVNQYECRIIPKSGILKWVDIYTKPILYEGRNAILSTFMDITVKKQIEEELKEVSRLKSELLSRTSHELKTPLVSIKGYADLLLNQHYEELDFYTISILHEIKQGCSRLESLIKDLLETSKLESGEIKLNIIEDDLAFLIRFCIRDLKGLVETRNHNLILDIDEEMITYFEKERIYEVIINLLSNAIKYTPPNGKIIIRSEVHKGNYVISVQDTGIGLTSDEKDKIFKKFGKIERYGQGLDVVSEGSGLGLYISKKIMELHGGNIWVKSKGRKKGSTFYFSLPIKPN